MHVRVGITADGGRHAAAVDGLPPDAPGLEAAVARLLGCPVERSLGGFRCRERRLVNGFEFSGQLDFAALAKLPGASPMSAAVLLPASPGTAVPGFTRRPPGWWPARTEFSGEPPASRPLGYRLGFSWVTLLAGMAPLPFLIYWLVRRPEPRIAWAVAMSAWLVWLGVSGTLEVDSFFWHVPSVEGAFLRWISWVPLCLLIVAQARWMGMPMTLGVWLPIAVLVLLRPRSAHWMTSGEQLLADCISLALLVLVAGPLVLRGRDRAALPEPLLIALHDRGWRLGAFDVRLDQPATGSPALRARLGRVVTIPAAWLARLQGQTVEAAVLLGCLRDRYAPIAAALGVLVAIWVLTSLPAQRLPGLMGVIPLAAYGAFLVLERRWERRIAEEATASGAEPAALREALAAIHPEWGGASARVASRLGASR